MDSDLSKFKSFHLKLQGSYCSIEIFLNTILHWKLHCYLCILFYCKSVTDGNTVLVWPRRFCLAHFRCRKDFYHQATWERRTLLEGHFYCWTSKNSVPIFILLNWIPPLAFCGACSDLLSCRTIWNFHFILYCLKTMCRILHCLLIFFSESCVISSTIKILMSH